jgi:EpsI family protein
MTRPQYYIIGLAMLAAAGLTVMLKPQNDIYTHAQKVDLEAVIPQQLGEWKIDLSLPDIQPSGDVQASLKKIYSQTLSRTYINSKGYKIMLSIAYGDGFDKQLDVHRPEYCYKAQGFEVGDSKDQTFKSTLGNMPLRRLIAQQGGRIEPISYWITIGGETVSGTFNRKMLKIRRMLTGQVDSGMLIRVSSIDSDSIIAYRNQEDFINALVKNIPEKNRKLVINIGENQ